VRKEGKVPLGIGKKYEGTSIAAAWDDLRKALNLLAPLKRAAPRIKAERTMEVLAETILSIKQ